MVLAAFEIYCKHVTDSFAQSNCLWFPRRVGSKEQSWLPIFEQNPEMCRYRGCTAAGIAPIRAAGSAVYG